LKAIIYARVSTARQAEDELPLQSQIEQCERKAAELGAEVVRRFVDEGISGTTDRRPAFRDAIAYCELEEPAYLITWSTSRFARNRLDAQLYKRRLARAGVKIVYVSQNIEAGTDSGDLLEGFLELFDDHYSRQVAADTKRSMVRNAQQGYWNGGNAPFGYKPVPAPGDERRRRLVPDAAEADVVARIFEMRLSGLGAKRIAEELNSSGLRHRGKVWSKSSVLGVLRSEAVVGRVIFNRKDRKNARTRPRDEWIIVQSHAPVIDESTWNTVQGMLDADGPGQTGGSHRSGWAFTGLLRCGGCNGSMQIETAKGRSKRYSYYNCRSNLTGKGCVTKRIRADVLEAWLLDIVLDNIWTPENVLAVAKSLEAAAGRWATETRRRRTALAQQLGDIQGRNHNLYEILELHGKDAPNLGDLTRRLQANNARIKEIERELAAIENSKPPEVSITPEQLDDVREFLADTVRSTQNNKKLRRFLQLYLRSIVINDGGDVQIEYDPVALVQPTGSSAVLSKEMWLPVASLLGTRIVALKLPPGMLRGGGPRGQAVCGQSAA
jgi:site-specific DNA recombinase